MITRTTLVAGAAGGILFLAGCFPVHQSVRRESFARVEAGQRDALFSRAVQVLLGRGWMLAAVEREAGVLATQPRETYVREWDAYLRDTVQISFRPDGRLAVSLDRQLRPATPTTSAPPFYSQGASGHPPVAYYPVAGPDPAEVAARAASEQKAILAEITSAADVSVLERCRQLASAYQSALAFARRCEPLGAHVCTGLRPAIDEGSQMLGTGEASVVPSRSADLDRVLAEYRLAGCAFSDRGASAAVPRDDCLGAVGSPSCQ